MKKELPHFQQYQQAFTAYIRDPIGQPRPKNVAIKGMNVYKEIVFNNLFESVSACFPVARKVLGKRAWLSLIHEYFRVHSANTPIFRKIPEEFLTYLTNLEKCSSDALPVYLTSLCHYEWIELLVSTMAYNPPEPVINNQIINVTGDLLEYQPAFNPTMQLLNYPYAVQKISPRYKPKEKVATQLLVFRNTEYIVKFIELNPITYRLIELLQDKNTTSKRALTQIANEIGNLPLEKVIQFGMEILNELKNQGIVLGVYNKPL
jgi:hypothetical protein